MFLRQARIKPCASEVTKYPLSHIASLGNLYSDWCTCLQHVQPSLALLQHVQEYIGKTGYYATYHRHSSTCRQCVVSVRCVWLPLSSRQFWQTMVLMKASRKSSTSSCSCKRIVRLTTTLVRCQLSEVSRIQTFMSQIILARAFSINR